MADHFDRCWELESHPACRLLRIRELEREVARLQSDTITFPVLPNGAYEFPLPCHDHIEPPIHAKEPTWAAHHDSPPSFTP